MGRKKKRRGCWACDRVLANERFSGGGHARHICGDCQELPAEELAYRQALRDLERCMTGEGIIPRKRRKQFNAFLEHRDPRIRQLANEMLAEDQNNRQLQRILAGDYDDECDGDLPEGDIQCDVEFDSSDEMTEWAEQSTVSGETDVDLSQAAVQGNLSGKDAVVPSAGSTFGDGRRATCAMLTKILEDALDARADTVELERVSEGLEVLFRFGNTGFGGVLVHRDHEQAVVDFLWDSARLDSRDRGQFQMELHACQYTVRVERYDLFGESAFRLRLQEFRKDAP